ncbi:MAG: barstar family protein [Aeromicrobium sp.]|uniref:barstar family protein n=1 Tax=Aeromicrobium sp. TaxID=1871063 RepID=UPI003C5746F7
MTSTLFSLLSGETPAGLFQWRGNVSRDIGGEGRSAGWVVRELDTRHVRDPDELYDQIAAAWELPSWFGRNLDALWDVLGDLAVSPLLVVWTGYGDLAEIDPELAQTVLELLRDASTQARAIAIVVLEAPALIDLDALL